MATKKKTVAKATQKPTAMAVKMATRMAALRAAKKTSKPTAKAAAMQQMDAEIAFQKEKAMNAQKKAGKKTSAKSINPFLSGKF